MIATWPYPSAGTIVDLPFFSDRVGLSDSLISRNRSLSSEHRRLSAYRVTHSAGLTEPVNADASLILRVELPYQQIRPQLMESSGLIAARCVVM